MTERFLIAAVAFSAFLLFAWVFGSAIAGVLLEELPTAPCYDDEVLVMKTSICEKLDALRAR